MHNVILCRLQYAKYRHTAVKNSHIYKTILIMKITKAYYTSYIILSIIL